MSFYKVLIIGDSATGKTSLAHRLVQNTFSEAYRATLGCEFSLKIVEVAGVPLRVQLWDIAGQDQAASLNRVYCRDASGVLVVCDLTKPQTIDRVSDWRMTVEEQSPGLPMVMCCNKVDLMRSSWTDQRKRCEALSEQLGFRNCAFVSAKTGDGAAEALSCLVVEMWNHKEQKAQAEEESQSVKLSDGRKPRRCGC